MAHRCPDPAPARRLRPGAAADEEGRRYWQLTRTDRVGLSGDDEKLRTFTQVFDDALQALQTADAG
ncbi:hypothetical protein [Streptomyces sp. NPDC002172]